MISIIQPVKFLFFLLVSLAFLANPANGTFQDIVTDQDFLPGTMRHEVSGT